MAPVHECGIHGKARIGMRSRGVALTSSDGDVLLLQIGLRRREESDETVQAGQSNPQLSAGSQNPVRFSQHVDGIVVTDVLQLMFAENVIEGAGAKRKMFGGVESHTAKGSRIQIRVEPARKQPNIRP